MSAVPKRRLSVAEYLAIENAAETKSEFFNGEMFAMSGATPEHNVVKDNLIGELSARLKGGPCRAYSSDQRLRINRTGLFAYPDIMIICGKLQRDEEDKIAAVNPRVVIEVLSKSTEAHDRGMKFEHYQTIETLEEYVLVAQNRMRVDRFTKTADGLWTFLGVSNPSDDLELASVGVSIPLSEIYRDVEFEPEPNIGVHADAGNNGGTP